MWIHAELFTTSEVENVYWLVVMVLLQKLLPWLL